MICHVEEEIKLDRNVFNGYVQKRIVNHAASSSSRGRNTTRFVWYADMGLHGNQLSASLRSNHHNNYYLLQMPAGEQTIPLLLRSEDLSKLWSKLLLSYMDVSTTTTTTIGYLKTTNMANFYYRNIPRSFSHGDQMKDNDKDNNNKKHNVVGGKVLWKQKPKSLTDLSSSSLA